MPQFDFFSFFVQIHWLVLGSFGLYILYTKYFIVNSGKILKIRKKIKQFNLLLSSYGPASFNAYNFLITKFKRS